MYTKKPTLQYAVLAVLLFWALIAQLTYSGFLIHTQATAAKPVERPFYLDTFSTKIAQVLPPYQNSGLRAGDDIVTINGQPLDSQRQLEDQWFALRPGDVLPVTVQRRQNGGTETLTIPVQMRKYGSRTLGWAVVIMFAGVLPLSCLLVGFYIAFARPLDPLAWITMAMLASFGQFVDVTNSWSIGSPWREMLLIYHSILSNSWPLWMLLFAYYFPIPFPFLKKRKWLLWLPAVPPALLIALEIYGDFKQGTHLRDLAALAALEKNLATPITVLFSTYVFSFFTLLGFKKRVVQSNDARRRLRVMIYGCSAALAPILPVVFGQAGLIQPLPPWLAVACLSMLVLFPITMAYVIVVQRAMDVRMVVRSGVRYAVANTGLKILRAVLIVAVVLLTIQFEKRADHQSEAILIFLAGAGLTLTVGKFARRASQWMDRRFFREAYNSERILTELSNSVAGIRDSKKLLETIAHRIADSLHVRHIAVLLENGGAFQPAYALGFGGPTPLVEFKNETSTIRTLKRLRSPSRIYFDDPQSWVHGTPDTEQAALQNLETQVLLPVNFDNRLLGLISLGSKRSDLPYTRADLQLLSAVASQTGLALENAHLTEQMRLEVAQRERLDRELEIARDVQQRLFPQKLPLVDGLDFAGYCRPAQGVGGDYYDFIRLPDGCLGIAVGDVSGKGIAAALMMASLQASLRGQTIKPAETLSEMIQHINRLVYDASADNRYATFFYAQYDPRKRVLRYVNAGHNPPMVHRILNNEDVFLRLDEGGTVVGLFPDFPYRDAQVQLEAGDVLVAFTDGISEAMNRREEEFDEERLMRTLSACGARTAADIITYVLNDVDGFTAGAKQHDDMTLVVVRLQ
ncbi:MAG TPA: SpoIIE family protein phosphatase [Bryobacteraceae bacterium]|nr:SpoIIE family protein phosphatase [Bryobacteraceae bacterium]